MVHMNNSSQQTIKVMHIVDEQEIVRYNMWRQNKVGKTFKAKELIEALESLALPQNSSFLTALVKHQAIIKNGVAKNTVYCVPPKPVHVATLQAVWESYQHPKKPKKFEMDIKTIVEKHPDEIIRQLKTMGYKILKCEWREL